MKRFLATAVLSLTALAGVCPHAQAWKTFNFGIGMNINYASGNNSFGWGLWQNGQTPPPAYFGGFGGPGASFPGGPMLPPTLPVDYPPTMGTAPGYDYWPGAAAMTPAPSPFQQASFPGYGGWYGQ